MTYRFTFTMLLAFAAAISSLSACSKQAEEPQGIEAFATPEEALESRVKARWDAALALDYDKVYEFATPAYRAAHDVQHLKNQYAAQIERTRIEIHKLTIDPSDPSTAEVIVLLYFLIDGPQGGAFESYSRIVETWLKRDGQWWYAEER